MLRREWTPNPLSMRFSPISNGVVLKSKLSSIQFSPSSHRDPSSIPSTLNLLLHERNDVNNVLLNPYFLSITVKKELDDDEWDSLQSLVEETLGKDLADSNEDDVGDEPSSEDSTVKLIKEIIDERVRPNLNLDGGDCEFVDYKDGIVFLKMVGACTSCPSSTSTMRFGIRNLLMHLVEDVKDVKQVFDEEDQVVGKGEHWIG